MIDINLITDGKIDGDGYFDVFMRSVNNHIKEAVDSNTITQEIAGAVYTGIIPSILGEGIKFEKEKEMLALSIKKSEYEIRALKIEIALKLESVPTLTRDSVLNTITSIVDVVEVV